MKAGTHDILVKDNLERLIPAREQELPAAIKIDKTFIMNMAAHKEDLVIVRSIIDLGHNLRR